MKSADEKTEFTDTFKQAHPDKDGVSKISFEGKMKATLPQFTHEGIVKNDGSISYESKFNFLGDLTKVTGLGLQLKAIAYQSPSDQKASV